MQTNIKDCLSTNLLTTKSYWLPVPLSLENLSVDEDFPSVNSYIVLQNYTLGQELSECVDFLLLVLHSQHFNIVTVGKVRELGNLLAMWSSTIASFRVCKPKVCLKVLYITLPAASPI